MGNRRILHGRSRLIPLFLSVVQRDEVNAYTTDRNERQPQSDEPPGVLFKSLVAYQEIDVIGCAGVAVSPDGKPSRKSVRNSHLAKLAGSGLGRLQDLGRDHSLQQA